jgi:NAD(P)-dependent dehydrogenase (short-subunit alcohol dehydrogenase family)
MGRFDGKVALVTGAAHGQGRAHVLGLAAEGADILAIDVPPPIASLAGSGYATANAADLAELEHQVEVLDRRMIARQGDVWKQEDLDELVADGLATFGHIDILVSNAGSSQVGQFVLFLASDDARKITGIAMPIDAGHLNIPGYLP